MVLVPVDIQALTLLQLSCRPARVLYSLATVYSYSCGRYALVSCCSTNTLDVLSSHSLIALALSVCQLVHTRLPSWLSTPLWQRGHSGLPRARGYTQSRTPRTSHPGGWGHGTCDTAQTT